MRRLALLCCSAMLACSVAGSEAPAPPDEAVAARPRPCPAVEPSAVAGCVDSRRLGADIRRVARARPPGSDQWRRVQRLCAETMVDLGYTVTLQRYPTGINVVGVQPGIERPEEHVVVGAHYDHIPGCEGADDNATGVAAVLEAARVLAGKDHRRSLVLACWDEEERGLVGSRAWVADARARGTKITVYFNFDAIGSADHAPGSQRVPAGFGLLFPDEVEALRARDNRADFITVVVDTPALAFARPMLELAAGEQLPIALLEVGDVLESLPLAIDLHRSDHASFWDAGFPAVMITDTAEFRSDAYHCRGRPDVVEGVDLAFGTKVVRASVGAIASALESAVSSHGLPAADAATAGSAP